MARHFKKITLAELQAKLEPILNNADFPSVLSTKIDEDVAKVEFDRENLEYTMSFGGLPVGYHVLANGMPCLFINAGGDWEQPLCFILYFDGKQIRGYIPTNGNVWNKKTKSAYGNEDDPEAEVIPLPDLKLIEADIITRITEKV